MFHSLKAAFRAQVEEQFSQQRAGRDEILSKKDVVSLPETVKRYLAFVGAVGGPRIRNLHLEFDVEMKRAPKRRPMIGTSEQFNFMANPAKLFSMSARLFGLDRFFRFGFEVIGRFSDSLRVRMRDAGSVG